MEKIRVLYRLVTVMCFVCLGFNVGMCSESDVLIKTYVSSSLPSDNDLLYSAKLNVDKIPGSEWESLVIQSKVPVMVFFTAAWCGPCRVMDSIASQLDFGYTDRFKFYRLDIDEEREIARRYGIRSIPTIIVFKGGEQKAKTTGLVSLTTLRQLVEKYM